MVPGMCEKTGAPPMCLPRRDDDALRELTQQINNMNERLLRAEALRAQQPPAPTPTPAPYDQAPQPKLGTLIIKWSRWIGKAQPSITERAQHNAMYGEGTRASFLFDQSRGEWRVTYKRIEIDPIPTKPPYGYGGRPTSPTWLPPNHHFDCPELGEDPILIVPPFRFEIKEPGKHTMWGTDLLTGIPCWWDTKRDSPNCWAWVRFWQTQVNYWKLAEEQENGAVNITEDGIQVNKKLYWELSGKDQTIWEWTGDGGIQFIGGMVDPKTLQQFSAKSH